MKFNTIGKLGLSTLIAISSLLPSQDGWALDQIIRPYQSARSSGMGGVRITTGVYDENFFGNPARVTANPKWKVTLLDPMIEVGTSTIKTAKDLAGGGNTLQKIGDSAGNDNHGRVQMTLPAVYIAKGEGKWAFAFGLIQSTQFDVALRQSYQVSPQALIDIGPAVTIGRTFLEEDQLSLGMTPHVTYRLASNERFGLSDLIRGTSVSPLQSGGEGAHVDFDIGATYKLPWELAKFKFQAGAAINNLLGGGYSNLPIHIAKSNSGRPPVQPRTYGVGISGLRENVGPFADILWAVELTDIGNNPNGSFFRLVHMGAEARWGLLMPRIGINQGYLAGGLGINLKALEIDLATYGEEMSLNVGGLQDRRYAFRISFQI